MNRKEKQNTKINSSPLPMQYLGSKVRIKSWILDQVKKEFPNKRKFIDLMTGTGTIAYEAGKRGYAVIANDIQPYSATLVASLLSTKGFKQKQLVDKIVKLKNERALVSNGRAYSLSALRKEDKLFDKVLKQPNSWREYSKFCAETSLVNVNADRSRLIKKGKWNLFIGYYANTYFGVRQCLEIDSLRELAEKLNKEERLRLLAATISVMTYAVSSTTHLAQYLRPHDSFSTQNLVRRRKISVVDEVIKRLELLHATKPIKKEALVTNLDYKELLLKDICKNAVVYVDPPYFKEHYSRYYHVLDTFCLYDFPNLTFNKVTKRTTEGRYREERFSSEFGKRAQVIGAFSFLFELCSAQKLDLVISYASTSLVNKKDIINLGKHSGYGFTLYEHKLMHSGQGQARHKEVSELLFVFKLKTQ